MRSDMVAAVLLGANHSKAHRQSVEFIVNLQSTCGAFDRRDIVDLPGPHRLSL